MRIVEKEEGLPVFDIDNLKIYLFVYLLLFIYLLFFFFFLPTQNYCPSHG